MNELIIEKNELRVVSEFKPAGDQPTAIDEVVEGLCKGEKNQVLLGATGTGKTFTMAKILSQHNVPHLFLLLTRHWQVNFLENSKNSFQKMQWNILSHITTTINQRLTFQDPILTLKKKLK